VAILLSARGQRMRDEGTPCRKLGRLARPLLLRSRNGVAS